MAKYKQQRKDYRPQRRAEIEARIALLIEEAVQDISTEKAWEVEKLRRDAKELQKKLDKKQKKEKTDKDDEED